jgi:hypothetical protein
MGEKTTCVLHVLKKKKKVIILEHLVSGFNVMYSEFRNQTKKRSTFVSEQK